MRLVIILGSQLIIASTSFAQVIPATHSYSGMSIAAAPFGIERDGPRFSAPRFEAAGMNSAHAFQNVAPLKKIKPAFRLSTREIDIPHVYDAIVFTETRPIRIRMHVKVAGTTLSKMWLAQLRRYFDYLDRDGDGVLNAFEAEFLMSNRGMQRLLATGQTYLNPNETGRGLADFDRDGDGVISFDEFIAYFMPSSALLIRAAPDMNRDIYSEKMNDELFKLLDRDRDGKLARAEVDHLEKLLPLLDTNEDECLSALELVPNLFANPSPVVGARATDSFSIVAAGTLPPSVVEQILHRYDKDKNLRLSKAESGLDDATFALLDKNGDGELDVAELLGWNKLPPDLSFELVLGANQTESIVKLRSGADGKPSSLAGAATMASDGNAIVRFGGQTINLAARANTATAPSPEYLARELAAPFRRVDENKMQYLIEEDIAGPQYQYLRIMFDLADRNGDGRLTRRELTDYLNLEASFASLPLALVHGQRPPSWFGLIDADGDGRLSVREMRNAWQRLRPFEPSGGEWITRAALKPQISIRLMSERQAGVAQSQTSYAVNIRPANKGPLWFRKMDRNNDGDVSRTEFLGRPEDFEKLDLNHDGLISVEEAEAADKLFRVETMNKK